MRGFHKTLNTCAQKSKLTCTCQKNPEEKWLVDCEADVRWAVVGDHVVKRYSVMDLGQDSPVLCLQNVYG